MDGISPWTVYWILQLDSIRSLFSFLAIGGLATAFGSVVFYPLLWDEHIGLLKQGSQKYMLGIPAVAAVVFGAASAFTPSTKTMAAIVIVPAVANSETIHREAGDLYSLAKQALAKAVAAEEKAPEKEAR